MIMKLAYIDFIITATKTVSGTVLSFILVLIFSFPAYAIMNIETLRSQNGEGFQGGINLNFLGEKGNSDKFTSNLRSLNAYIKNRHEVLILTNYTYGESFATKDTHKGSAHLRYTFRLHPLFNSEFFTQAEFDEFRRLDFRQISGIGLRSPILKNDSYSLAVGYGGFYEYEVYNETPNEERVRFNFYMTYFHELNSNVSFSTTVYIQPDIENFEDLRAIASPILKTKITDSLALISLAHLRFDNLPVPDTERYDLSYNFGFSYDF